VQSGTALELPMVRTLSLLGIVAVACAAVAIMTAPRLVPQESSLKEEPSDEPSDGLAVASAVSFHAPFSLN
jgi:hypothetical protein